MPMSATKLEQLFIGEVSGVDDPANQTPGWMVAKAAGHAHVEESSADSDAGILARIRKLLGQDGDTPGKEDLQMDKTELTALLDERDTALVEKVADIVKSAVEAASAEATPAPAETTPAASDDVTKAEGETPAGLTEERVTELLTEGIEKAVAPILEILDKVIDRTAAVEKAGATRFSLDGQEGGDEVAADTTKELTPLQKAIQGALRS